MPQTTIIRKLTRKELSQCDPMLLNPDQNIEHNLAEGIDDLMPDPDDIPSGFNVNGTLRPDIMESDAQCLAEHDLLCKKVLELRK